jgi:hypothetical protein
MRLNEQHTQQHSEASTLFLGLDVHKKPGFKCVVQHVVYCENTLDWVT